MMASESSNRIVVVNICCTAYSGGTWLNLMLGSHPESFGIGEMKWLRRMDKATCTLHGETCPVWSRFDLRSDQNPFLRIHEITGKHFHIINQSRKFLIDQRHPRIKSKFVHFVRDGRAVMASILRKYADRPSWKVARLWAHNVKRNARLVARQPQEDTCELNYEALLTDPPGQLKRICEEIDMPFDQDMVEYWKREHHYIGGNRGTLLAMANERNDQNAIDQLRSNSASKGPTWDLAYYRKSNPAEFVDERWRRELSARQLRVFRLFAGQVNRKYGYSATVNRNGD